MRVTSLTRSVHSPVPTCERWCRCAHYLSFLCAQRLLSTIAGGDKHNRSPNAAAHLQDCHAAEEGSEPREAAAAGTAGAKRKEVAAGGAQRACSAAGVLSGVRAEEEPHGALGGGIVRGECRLKRGDDGIGARRLGAPAHSEGSCF
jgi:hypothetical protein